MKNTIKDTVLIIVSMAFLWLLCIHISKTIDHDVDNIIERTRNHAKEHYEAGLEIGYYSTVLFFANEASKKDLTVEDIKRMGFGNVDSIFINELKKTK